METIRVVKRFNDGDYQHTEIEVTRAVEEGNLINDIIALEAQIVSAYKRESIPGGKSLRPYPKPVEVKEEVKEEVVVKEEPKKVAKKKTAKKATKKKPVAPKTVPYNRETQTHKDEFASLLNDKYSDWKKTPENIALAKAASVSLDGTEMFGEDGKVLTTFINMLDVDMHDYEPVAEL